MRNSNNERRALPLNSIRVFVEAARRGSFSQAARTLGLTQSGVSHHVSGLEKHLGHRLFMRRGAAIELTDAGRLYFDTVQEAMGTLELATLQFAPPVPGARRLVVRTSLPTFAMTVLIPALPRFVGEPTTTVDVITSLSPPQPGEAYDLLISRDLSIGDDETHWQIATEDLVCVAAPAMLTKNAERSMADWPFIVARSRPDTLPFWANRQALDVRGIRIAAAFEHYFLAIPAAVAGMGFLVVPRLLVAESMRAGLLVTADAPAVRGDASYKAFINPHSGAPETATAFCRWLKAELRDRSG